MEKRPLNVDVIVALERLTSRVEARFDIVDDRFGLLDDRYKHFNGKLETVQRELVSVRGGMVTRDYLDERLLSVRNDFGLLLRREDAKLNMLIDALHLRSIISDDERNRMLGIGPYPQMSAG